MAPAHLCGFLLTIVVGLCWNAQSVAARMEIGRFCGRDWGEGDYPSVNVTISNDTVNVCASSTCAGRCNTDKKLVSRGCFCDKLCLAYGDCCPDYEAVCVHRSSQHSENSTNILSQENVFGENDFVYRMQAINKSRLLCKEFSNGRANHPLLVESKCPTTLPMHLEPYRDKCEKRSTIQGTDAIAWTLIMLGHILYDNIYCAICHGKLNISMGAPKESLMYPPRFKCDNIDIAIEKYNNDKEENLSQYLFANCSMSYGIDGLSFKTRFSCNVTEVDIYSVPTGDKMNHFKRMCFLYRSVVSVKVGGDVCIYDNPHCALLAGVDNYKCAHIGPWVQSAPFMRFRVLIDFSNLKTSAVKYRRKTRCLAGYVWDALIRNCVRKNCENNTIHIHNECVSFVDNITQMNTDSLWQTFTVICTIQTNFSENMEVPAEFKSAVRAAISLLVVKKHGNISVEFLPESIKNLSVFKLNTLSERQFDSGVQVYKNGYQSLTVSIKIELNSDAPFDSVVDDFLSQSTLVAWVIRMATNQIGIPTGIYLMNHDALKANYECVDGVLVEEEDIAMTTSSHISTSKSILVKRTSMTYNISQVPLVVNLRNLSDVYLGPVKMIALICEATILSCNSTIIPQPSYVRKGSSLKISKDGYDEYASEGEHILLSSGEAVICSYILDILAGYSTGDYVQGILTLAGNVASMIGLVVTLLVHLKLPDLRSVSGCSLMCLCAMLLLAQLLFQVCSYLSAHPLLCITCGATTHYMWLSAFAWMSAMAFDICKRFSILQMPPFVSSSPLYSYMAYSWISPLVPVVICLALSEGTDLAVVYATDTSCWLGDRNALFFAFVLPIILVVSMNATFFIKTAVSIRRCANDSQLARNSAASIDLWIYFRIMVIMGFTWIFGFLANVEVLSFLYYPFIICNTLQGVLICISFCFTKRVLTLWRAAKIVKVHKGSLSTIDKSNTYPQTIKEVHTSIVGTKHM